MESHKPSLPSTSFFPFRRYYLDTSPRAVGFLCVFLLDFLSYGGLFLSDFLLLCSVLSFSCEWFRFGIFYGVLWLSCKCFHCWIFSLWKFCDSIFSHRVFPFCVDGSWFYHASPVFSLSSSWFSHENHLVRSPVSELGELFSSMGQALDFPFSWPFLATWFRIVIWFVSPVFELGELFIGSVVLTEPF